MRVQCVVMIGIVLLLPSISSAGDTPWDVKLPFKEAVVTYELGGVESGQETLYIKDYGEKTARYRTTSSMVLGITQTVNSVEIVTPEWIYTFDLQEGTGTKSVNPQKLMIEEYRKLTPEEKIRVDANGENMAGALRSGLHGSVEPDARTVLGYSCDRITGMGTIAYSIHNSGITLLSESNIMGVKISRTAVALETRGVDDSFFEFPNGIVPQPSPVKDQVAALIARQTIGVLKGSEGVKAGSQGTVGILPAEGPAIPEEDQLQMQEVMKTIKGLFGN